MSWFPLLRETPPSADWQLIVRHRRGGSLGAFVGDMHRRDLAISFGALLLLVIALTMWIVVGNRAQRLARLQMDFVTAVSHELRTPLSVISSAADNITHGIVHGQQQMTQYGSVIAAQSKKLSKLVEEILLFTSVREARQRYQLLRVDVAELVDSALAASSELIQSSGFTVERDIAPDVPQVTGDPAALSQCLQNLITNALKYGGSQRWLAIRARVAEVAGGGGQEAQISVSDRGMGIDTADLPHIFDPFFRSHAAAVAQIHGTGLGLSLARSIAEAMNGRVTVTTALGRGSTFTVHLPCPALGADRV
jgi:signal transduction histidine kinase